MSMLISCAYGKEIKANAREHGGEWFITITVDGGTVSCCMTLAEWRQLESVCRAPIMELESKQLAMMEAPSPISASKTAPCFDGADKGG